MYFVEGGRDLPERNICLLYVVYFEHADDHLVLRLLSCQVQERRIGRLYTRMMIVERETLVLSGSAFRYGV